jgi:hypothetical protein
MRYYWYMNAPNYSNAQTKKEAPVAIEHVCGCAYSPVSDSKKGMFRNVTCLCRGLGKSGLKPGFSSKSGVTVSAPEVLKWPEVSA